ncbi:TonB-dependent receptor [Sphingomonas koreensis]|nr:TonB-dependent receptor [Sphingomonas koreensis]
MIGLALPAHAQTTPAASPSTTEPEQTTSPSDTDGQASDIVVTGIRASLADAQSIKRNSDTIVDAITAQDIGALPDRSVTEALQRVPGVSISRFAGSNDPDHFSVEGSGVVVRGLNFVRSEFNGRDAFSAGVGGQSLNFADVPAELLGSVEVYKNVTAAAIEGGLAGTVNLNTRKPFDNKGLHIGVDMEGNYGDLEKKWSPTGSVLITDTWNTGIGTFGLLADGSYSRIRSRADGIQITNIQQRDNTQVAYQSGNGVLTCRNPLPGNSDDTAYPPATPNSDPTVNSGNPIPPPCGSAQVSGASDGFADPLSNAYAPLGGQYRTQDFDRKRDGIAIAAQYETLDKSFLLTGQFIRSHTTNSWGEHTFEAAPDLSEYDTYPIGCVQNSDGPLYNGNATTRAECPVGQFTNYQYDDNGLFQSGYITTPGTGFRTSRSGDPATTFFPTGGAQTTESRRQVYEENLVNDYGLNAQITPTDRWSINLDADYTTSHHQNFDVGVYTSTFADQELDLTGNLPSVITHKPNTLQAGWAGTTNETLAGETDAQYFADPNTSFWRAAIDHFEDSKGHEFQFAANSTYKFGDDGGFIDQIKFGARYADRDQTVRYSSYNWGMLSEVWAGYPESVAAAGVNNAEFYAFPNFFRGATNAPPGAYYYGGDIVNDYGGFKNFIGNVEQIARDQPGAEANTQSQFNNAADRPGAIAGSPYLPSEVQRVHVRDSAAYLMLPFNSDTLIDGINVAGNIGVRYVHTGLDSFGTSTIPTQGTLQVDTPFADRCAERTAPAGAPPGTPSSRPGGVCNLGEAGYAQLQQFAGTTANNVFSQAKNSYTYWLPSFNLKVGLTHDFQIRLAASKVLTRPDEALIRNFQQITVDGNGNFNSTVGNPYLKPATAWQFDATAEWYFSRVGSLTIDAFYKDVKGFFYQSVVSLPITNNGVTFPFLTRGPANYDGDGKIKGVEVAYQQTFDFLPGFLSGLGVSANYSYIVSSGLPNSFLNTGSPSNVNAATVPGSLPLEGLSKHNANATVFYEKGPFSLRAAYNYRSKYLLTAADVIFPYTSIFQAGSGQLDASAFFSLTKYLKIGVQGVNLTNSVTKTLQAYTSDPSLLAPRSYFVNDRRYSFILRANF